MTVWEQERQNRQGHEINGDPLEDIAILIRPEENLALIMKDGKMDKSAL